MKIDCVLEFAMADSSLTQKEVDRSVLTRRELKSER